MFLKTWCPLYGLKKVTSDKQDASFQTWKLFLQKYLVPQDDYHGKPQSFHKSALTPGNEELLKDNWHAVHSFLLPVPWPSNKGATAHGKSLWSTSIKVMIITFTERSQWRCVHQRTGSMRNCGWYTRCKSDHEHLEQSLLTEDAPQMCSHWWNDSCCGHVTHAGIGWEPHSPKIPGISKSVCWCHWHCLRSQRVWGRALSNPNKEVGKSIEGMRNWRGKQLYDTVVGNNLRKASRHYQTKENSFPKVLRKSIRFNS